MWKRHLSGLYAHTAKFISVKGLQFLFLAKNIRNDEMATLRLEESYISNYIYSIETD